MSSRPHHLAAALVLSALAISVVSLPAAAQEPAPTAARLDAVFSKTEKATTIITFRVVGAVAGTKARLTCSGGKDKGCPKPLRGRARTVRAEDDGAFSLRRPVRGAAFKRGATLVVTVTDPGARFRRETFAFGKPGSYTQITRCEGADGAPAQC